MKITDRRGSRGTTPEAPTQRTSSLVLAKDHSDIRRAASAPTQQDADNALVRGRNWSHPDMDRASSRRRSGSATISPAAQKPRDLEYYLDQNTEHYDIRTLKGLFDLQDVCRRLYIHHPMIGTAVDIFSKWPLVGMEFRSKDEDLAQFYSELFIDDLGYEDFLVDIGREFWTAGETFPLGSWNETLGVWERDELIKPRDVDVKDSAFLPEPLLMMRLPEEVRRILTTRQPPEQYHALARAYPELVNVANDNSQNRGYFTVSSELLKHLKFKGDTFFPRGIPILTRGIRAALQEEMLNTAQDSIADRMSTPLLLVRLGATATELGTQNPWIPSEDELADFEAMLNAAMAADFRVMTTHFGVKAENVFGREAMPNFDNDFDRISERLLQVFGLSKTMLSGAGSGETYAADAMNRDLVTQLMSSHQRMLKRFVRERMLVVAEAREHYDYEERNGKRYVVMEEVLLVDEQGNQYVEERPKLLVPELHLKPMSLKDESKEREELERMRAAGVPISHRRRLTNMNIDLDEEVEASREERIMLALEEQKARKATYLALKKEGLPIPEDLRNDFDPKPGNEGDQTASQPSQPAPVIPALGETEQPLPQLAPVAGDPGADAAPGAANATQPGGAVIPMEGRTRPPESDEMRAEMPKAGARRRVRPVRAMSLTEGPSHLAKRGQRVVARDLPETDEPAIPPQETEGMDEEGAS